MGARIISTKSNLQTIIVNVYGPSLLVDKLALWKGISAFINSMPLENIIIGGDFNVVLCMEEKKGGSNQVCKTMEDFKDWIQKDSLMDIKTKNGIYTWNNRRKGLCYIAE